jgi:glycosyltransferase involved in cell wall biosynthesis
MLGPSSMKILFNCHLPFMLAHGGMQIQIEQTMAALHKIGVSVEPLRWWDETQTGDVLHHYNRIPLSLVIHAQQKGMKVVVAELLTEMGSRSAARLRLQRMVTRALQRTLPASALATFNLESYRQADACLLNTPSEGHLMRYLYGVPKERVHIVANGVEDVFFQSPSVPRGSWLVCTGTITPRKRILELARSALEAKTPLWVVGKPYHARDPYACRFFELAKQNPEILRYEGAITSRAELARVYRAARGFVLLSTMETRSLSAEEAAACECPLLLSDLPWAHDVFKTKATYCPVNNSVQATAEILRGFYQSAPQSEPPPRPASWVEVAQQMKSIYEAITH